MTTAGAFQAEGLDLIFFSSRQLSASTEWTYSQVLWPHSQGELTTIKLEPNSACRGYELPQLDEPTAYGGYSLDNGVVRFSATYFPNQPEMAYVSASLKVIKSHGGYSLGVASCKVERPR